MELPFFIEELRLQLQLPFMQSETQVLQSRLEKREMIELEFYSTDAMINRSWEEPNNEL